MNRSRRDTITAATILGPVIALVVVLLWLGSRNGVAQVTTALLWVMALAGFINDRIAAMPWWGWLLVGFWLLMRQLVAIDAGVVATRDEIAALHDRIRDIEADRARPSIE